MPNQQRQGERTIKCHSTNSSSTFGGRRKIQFSTRHFSLYLSICQIHLHALRCLNEQRHIKKRRGKKKNQTNYTVRTQWKRRKKTFQINFYYISSDIRFILDKDIQAFFCVLVITKITCKNEKVDVLYLYDNKQTKARRQQQQEKKGDWNINEFQLNVLTIAMVFTLLQCDGGSSHTLLLHRVEREANKNCFQIHFGRFGGSRSPIKISNESEIKFIYFFLFIVPVVISLYGWWDGIDASVYICRHNNKKREHVVCYC